MGTASFIWYVSLSLVVPVSHAPLWCCCRISGSTASLFREVLLQCEQLGGDSQWRHKTQVEASDLQSGAALA